MEREGSKWFDKPKEAGAGKIKVIPSIASADQLRLKEEIDRISGWDSLHIDIEDGNFVPNITFGEKTIRAIAAYTTKELDAHILACHPQKYLRMLHECGVKKVAFHVEAVSYPLEILGEIRSLGMKAGLALNFSTDVQDIEIFFERLDYVLVMTSEPDFAGQKFYPPIIDKIKKLRENLPDDKEIWVDGGIGPKELEWVREAGADTAVMGRAVFGKR